MARRSGTGWKNAVRGILLLMPFLCLPDPAAADLDASLLERSGFPPFETGRRDEISRLQLDLAWTGLLTDRISGEMDGGTRAAIGRYQEGVGAPLGPLTDSQRGQIARIARMTRQQARYRLVTDAWTGVRLSVPSQYLQPPVLVGSDHHNVLYEGRGPGGLSLTIERYIEGSSSTAWVQSLEAWARKSQADILAQGTAGTQAFMVAERETESGTRLRHYMYYEVRSNEVRGVDIRVVANERDAMRPLVREMLRGFDAFAGPGATAEDRRHRRPGDFVEQPDWYKTMIANGSGSIVSAAGHVLTNHHVVSGCGRLTVNGTEAHLLGTDVFTDLAVVRAPEFAGRYPIRMSDRTPDLGDTVVVMGYPIFRFSPSLNLTTGVVSSSVGMKGDRTTFQITAPVQPGNSGGPVLSSSGTQIAIVAAKPTSVLKSERNIENIGYAIRSTVAINFLRRYGVPIVTAGDENPPHGLPADLREWRRLAVRVECHR